MQTSLVLDRLASALLVPGTLACLPTSTLVQDEISPLQSLVPHIVSLFLCSLLSQSCTTDVWREAISAGCYFCAALLSLSRGEHQC